MPVFQEPVAMKCVRFHVTEVPWPEVAPGGSKGSDQFTPSVEYEILPPVKEPTSTYIKPLYTIPYPVPAGPVGMPV